MRKAIACLSFIIGVAAGGTTLCSMSPSVSATLSPTQSPAIEQDPKLNNLVHPDGYKTAPLGELGQVEKIGRGPIPMILIPGLGFSWHVYEDFMKANQDKYTMYAVTVSGVGGTAAPPMPEAGTSYGEQTWTRAAQQAIVKLLDREKLDRPIIIGQFLQGTQLAFRLAIDHPEKIRGVVIIGGTPKFARPDLPPLTLDQRINFTDNQLAPQWYKTVTKKSWHENMFPSNIYTRDPVKAQQLWQESADVPIPIMVRYLCEFFASDVSPEFKDVKAPTLVLLPDFHEEVFKEARNQYVKSLFIDSWEGTKEANPLIEFQTIGDAHLFIMMDQLERLNAVVERFVNRVKRAPGN